MDWPILSVIIFLPFLGSLVVALFPGESKKVLKGTAMFFMLANLALAVYLFIDFGGDGIKYMERMPWITTLGIDYIIGVDALNILMILVTTFLFPIALIAGWNRIDERGKAGESVKLYLALLLGLEAALLGAYAALDIFLFYIFYEAMLIPMYFIIGLFGGERRKYATTRFVIYTIIGSLLMLVAILVIYFEYHGATGQFTGDIAKLSTVAFSPGIKVFLFFAFIIAFGIKSPLWPLHSWMPDAYVQSPSSGSVLLAGLMSKVGIYGFIRFVIPLFHDLSLAYAPLIMALAAVAVIYGAMIATVQQELKRMVAFFSFSHVGMILIGIFSMNNFGVEGAVLQMANHAIVVSAFFIIIGIINDRSKTTDINDFGGIGAVVPKLSTIFMITILAAVGLPGLNGFVAELLIILGAFKSSILFGILVASGALLGAICMLWMYERVFFGKVTKKANSSIKDLSIRELAALIPLIIIMFWIGLFPGYILNKIGPGIEKYTTDFSPYTEIIEIDENATYDSNPTDLINTTSNNSKLENSDAGGLR